MMKMNNYDLSIIIAHYLPNKLKYSNPLIKTLNLIAEQKENFNIEVIIADDGSNYTKHIQSNYDKIIENNKSDRKIYYIESDKINDLITNLKLKNNLINKWVYLPKDKQCMSKARVINASVKLSNSSNLLFLDDDNYFISSNTIKNINQLLNQYNLIIGQIKDNNGRLRGYSSNRVQGTTIAINKKILIESGGFGEWTESFSCGVDSDLWIKLYNYFNKNLHLKACYTDKISTFDSQSKRWKKYTKFFKEWNLKRKFNEMYNCKNYKSVKSNLSRNKKLWIDNLIDPEL